MIKLERLFKVIFFVLFVTGNYVHSAEPSYGKAGSVTTFEDGKYPTRFITVKKDGTGDFTRVEYALRDAVINPGTAIQIYPGEYASTFKSFKEGLHGTVDHPIWIGGADPDNRPVLTAQAAEVLKFSKFSYLVLHDMVLKRPGNHGINVDDGGELGSSNHLVIRNSLIKEVPGGRTNNLIKISGVNDFYIFDNELSDAGTYLSPEGGNTTAVDAVGCHVGVIENNHISNIAGQALKIKGGSTYVKIRRNFLYNAGEIAICLGYPSDFALYRPPVAGNDNSVGYGHEVIGNIVQNARWPIFIGGVQDSLIANNTFINPEGNRPYAINFGHTEATSQFLPNRNNTIINNVFYVKQANLDLYQNGGLLNMSDSAFIDTATMTFKNNLWYTWDDPSKSQPDIFYSYGLSDFSGEIWGEDPMLNEDFIPMSGSPLIDAGIYDSRVIKDFEGNNYGNPPSIGAYDSESDGGSNTGGGSNTSGSKITGWVDGWSSGNWGNLSAVYDENLNTALSSEGDPGKYYFALWRNEAVTLNRIRIYQQQSKPIRIKVSDDVTTTVIFDGDIQGGEWIDIDFPARAVKWFQIERAGGSASWDVVEVETWSGTDSTPPPIDTDNNEVTGWVDGWSSGAWGSLVAAYDGDMNTVLSSEGDPGKYYFALWRNDVVTLSKIRIYQQQSKSIKIKVSDDVTESIVFDGDVSGNQWVDIDFPARPVKWFQIQRTGDSASWDIVDVETWN